MKLDSDRSRGLGDSRWSPMSRICASVGPPKSPRGNGPGTGPTERAIALKGVLSSRLFLVVATSTGIAYLAFSRYLDFVANAPVMAGTDYFVLYYLLIAVSSILMGLNVYSLRSTLMKRRLGSNATFGSSSAATSLFGGVISCSCHTSLLLPLLSFVGLSSISGIGLISSMVQYQFWILVAFVALNLYLVYRVLGKIQPGGSWAKRRGVGQMERARPVLPTKQG